MNIQLFHFPCEYILVNNIYSKNDLDGIWLEIDFLHNNLLNPEKTGTAYNTRTKEYLKHGKGIFLDDVYKLRNCSNILTVNRKIWQDEILNASKTFSGWWQYYRDCDKDYTLLNYYDDKDFYEYHKDHSIFTAITTLYKEPVNFTGGYFNLKNKQINLSNNSLLIFPSHVEHKVNELSILDKTLTGYGRYSIVQFLYRDSETNETSN